VEDVDALFVGDEDEELPHAASATLDAIAATTAVRLMPLPPRRRL
jgi:hypothetical protein